MANHHFISYSPVDAENFAIKICDDLQAGPPSIPTWLDKRKLKAGQDWDDQIVEAIRTCDSLIFIMTCDSVESQSVCKNEWTRAMKYKKPIISILLHTDAEVPFQLENRHYIEFTGDFDTALAKLRNHIKWLSSPEGKLQAMKDRLTDAKRDLHRADDPAQKNRIQDDIVQLKKQIANQKQIVADPVGTEKRVQESINRGLERERKPEKPVSGKTKTKFINPPPGIAPIYFQDRHVETKLIGDFLKNDAQRLMTITGRAGIGKTVMVCRLLKSLESGQLPDDDGPLSVDGIVYLSETGSRKVNFPNLYADLSCLLPEDIAKKMSQIYKNPKVSTGDKMQALLSAFPHGRVLLMLDNFEDKINLETRDIKDTDMDEALQALLSFQQHAVKVILTTRIALRSLSLVQPGRQCHLDVDDGLESPYAENILREMDTNGKFGLKSAPDELLNEARQRTLGYPRALEALFAILSADRETSLQEILDDTEKLLPEFVVEKLVGEAFCRLDSNAQMVMQALATYARPVSSAAVDYLLQPYLIGVDSAPVLNRLVNMQFVCKETGHYYLHPVDRDYALSRVPKGEISDRNEMEEPLFTQFALLHRGADYFQKVRKPRKDWKSIDDLAPQLSEFALRYEGQDFDTAASVLFEIDSDYLCLWGHYRLLVELHEQLQGKINDPELKQNSVGDLGWAYRMIGKIHKAINCVEQALDSARERKDPYGESIWLGNLGSCYIDGGQIVQAVDYLEQALEIAGELDFYPSSIFPNNIGVCYTFLGQNIRAISCLEQALKNYRKYTDLEKEATCLCSLSLCFNNLGQAHQAIEHSKQSLVIAKKIGDRYIESYNYVYLGHIFLDQEKVDRSVEQFNQAILIADEIMNTELQNETRYGLALAYLFSDKLYDARNTLEEACKYNYPLNYCSVLVLLGLIALRQGDLNVAQESFITATKESDILLRLTEKNLKALDSKGLALCGLAICDKNEDYIQDAIKVYKKARGINKDTGVIGRVMRLLDELAKADTEGIIKEARGAAYGELGA